MRHPLAYILTASALLLCIGLNAQMKSFSLGPKVGMMLGAPIPHGSDASIDSTGGAPLLGPNLGVFFLVRFNDKFGLWIESGYNRKATEYWARATDLYYVDEQCIPLSNGGQRCAEIETIFNGQTWGKFDNHYYEIDAIGRYSFNEKWHLNLGMYYASLIQSQSQVQYNGFVGASSTRTVSERDLSVEMSSHDLGAILGFQYRYKPLLVDFRASYGLTSIVREDYRPITYDIQNLYTQLSVAYQFFLKKEKDKE